jgi:hypothetical protein
VPFGIGGIALGFRKLASPCTPAFLKNNPFDLIERDPVDAAIVKLESLPTRGWRAF